MKKIIFYGTGRMYQKYKNRFSDCEILALIDSDCSKWGKEIDNHVVYGPSEIVKFNFDYIIILIYDYAQVKERIRESGVEESKIVTLDDVDFLRKYRQVQVLGKETDNTQKRILLLSHEMNFRGAPLMLRNMAKIFVEMGFGIDVVCKEKGELYNDYINIGARIFIFDDFNFSDEELNSYFTNYSLIVVNTLVFWKVIFRLKMLNTKILWWIHEEESGYKILNVDLNEIEPYDALHVYGGGRLAVDAFVRHSNGRIKIHELRWGIEECKRAATQNKTGNKLILAIIAPICYVKGQDFFVDALTKNGSGLIYSIEVLMIGSIDQKQKELFERTPCIKCLGEMTHDQLLEIYPQIDIVLSVSRYDTLPVVLIEGLMNHKVCIMADCVGVADYITNFKNGIVFKTEDCNDIIEKIQWCVDNKGKLKQIGEEGYKIFSKNFSYNSFKTNVEKTLKEIFND